MTTSRSPRLPRLRTLGHPATGNTINVSLCDYFRVDHGALVEHWGVMDAAGMMQQLTAH